MKIIGACMAVGSILALGACAGEEPRPTPRPEPITTSINDFCSDLIDQGGDATTLGPVQATKAKEDLAAEVDARIAAMEGLNPPSEIADAWSRYRSYYRALDSAIDALPARGLLSDPLLLQKGNALTEQTSQFTAYWFAHCD